MRILEYVVIDLYIHNSNSVFFMFRAFSWLGSRARWCVRQDLFHVVK